MKENFRVIGGIVLAVILVLGGAALVGNLNAQKVQGSVNIANDYHSTTTDATWTSPRLIQTGNGTLGSVVITTAGTGRLSLYDATTTNSSLRTKSGTTTLANFNVTTTVGTYTFDSQFYDGLIVEFSGANVASTTITSR